MLTPSCERCRLQGPCENDAPDSALLAELDE
jgi:hypothetical protein